MWKNNVNHAPIYGTYDVPYKNGQQNGIAIYGHRLLLFHAKMIPYKEKTKRRSTQKMLLPNAIYVRSSIILPVGKDMSNSWGV